MTNPAESSPPLEAWREQIWFARICLVFGADQLVSLATNLFTLLKVHSGLPIVATATYRTYGTAYPYVVVNLVMALFLVTGGTLPGCLAYARILPRHLFFRPVEFPTTREILSLSFRGLGIEQLISAATAMALAIYYKTFAYLPTDNPQAPAANIEWAWAFERGLFAFVLIIAGGRIADLLRGRGRTAKREMEYPASKATF
ncbi:MAG TPA: hypothetical protein VHD32_14300 [Candidatus Didemnitutus sp.]|nr:hypothetical protein [Candidatus Didemnitutus sp.]